MRKKNPENQPSSSKRPYPFTIPDRFGNYDIDGVSMSCAGDVVVASDNRINFDPDRQLRYNRHSDLDRFHQ